MRRKRKTKAREWGEKKKERGRQEGNREVGGGAERGAFGKKSGKGTRHGSGGESVRKLVPKRGERKKKKLPGAWEVAGE